MNRCVVVTGAGHGIGRAILERLMADGWYVVGLDRDAEQVAVLEAVVRDRGAAVHGDVADVEALDRVLAAGLARAPLGGWVNNAGTVRRASLHQATPADVRATLTVNLEAAFWGCATAVRTFLDQSSSGAIVNISSIHGRQSAPGHAAYEMSKGGIDALTRSIAVEYGGHGIRANAVAPGVIRTQILEQVLDESDVPSAVEHDLAETPPLRRIGEPTEIAAVASFLLSDEASYLTGQCIAVDGGWSAALLAGARRGGTVVERLRASDDHG